MVAVPGQSSLLSLVLQEMLFEVTRVTVGGVTNITFVHPATSTTTTSTTASSSSSTSSTATSTGAVSLL